jgi:hypothetical protein
MCSMIHAPMNFLGCLVAQHILYDQNMMGLMYDGSFNMSCLRKSCELLVVQKSFSEFSWFRNIESQPNFYHMRGSCLTVIVRTLHL